MSTENQPTSNTQLISTKTLVRIAEHGDKLIRLALFVAEMDAKFMLGATSFLDAGSSAPEIAEAFDKDLGSTAVLLKKIALIVENLNDEHVSPELLSKYKKEDCDLRALFPKNYDSQDQSLTLFGVEMSRRTQVSSLDNNDVKAKIYNHVLGELTARFAYADFRKQVSVLKKLQDSEKPTADSEDFKIYSHAMLLSSVYDWTDFYSHIMESVHQEASFRRELTFEQRQLVDERIAGGRAMLDGVIKNSTYITKNEVVQVASAHKDPSVLQAVAELAKNIDCIRAVEVDSSASLVKIHDLLLQIKDMDLKIPDAFELKVRLLGNYRVSGMFMTRGVGGEISFHSMLGVASPALRIVAVDPKTPTSIAHELAHFCDRDESDPGRNRLIHHFRDKMLASPIYEEGLVSPSYMNYLLSPAEVFARLGEIGFTLLKVGFVPGDTVDDVKRKASLLQVEEDDDRISYDIALSKDFSTYLGRDSVSAWMYFDVSGWDTTELFLVQQLARSLYKDPSPECKVALRHQIEQGLGYYNTLNHQKKKPGRRKRETTDREKIAALFSKLSEKDLVKTVDVVIREGMARHGDVAETLAMNLHKLDVGSRSSASLATLHSHVKALVGCVEVMLEHGYMADAHLTYEVMLRTSARLLVMFSSNQKTEFEQQLLADLSSLHVAGDMLGALGESQKMIHGEKERVENPFALPYHYGWSVTSNNAQMAERLLENITPKIEQIRARLLADSGAPGILSPSLAEQPVELNELARARLVAGLFYQTAKNQSLSESAFDWWHQNQNLQMLKSFSTHDKSAVEAIKLSGQLGSIQALNAASLEWQTFGVQNDLVQSFVHKNKAAFDAVPSRQLSDWIAHNQSVCTELNERAASKTMSSTLLLMLDDDFVSFSPPVKGSTSDVVVAYAQHCENSLSFRESIVLKKNGGRPETVSRPVIISETALEDAYSGTILYGQTPARFLSGMLDKFMPEMKSAWFDELVKSEALKQSLQAALRNSNSVGLANFDYEVDPNWRSPTQMYNMSGLRKMLSVHPSAVFFKGLMMESGRNIPGSHVPSAILASGMHFALLSRLSDGETPVAMASCGTAKMLISAKESVNTIAARSLDSVGDFASELFSVQYGNIPETAIPIQIQPELEHLKSEIDYFLRVGHQFSPEATDAILNASVFAQREFDVSATMKANNKPMQEAISTISANLRVLSTPLLMSDLFLKPSHMYMESIQEWPHEPEIPPAWEQGLLQTTPLDLQHESIAFDVPIEPVGLFEDAPVVPVQNVSLSSFSEDVKEQLAYFMNINADIPSAGVGPLMPKKHQMRLF